MCHPDLDAGAPVALDAARESRLKVKTSGVEMPVYQVEPAGDSNGVVVIIHDIFGANPFYEELARRFASEGYTALLPNLFVRQGPLPEQTREAAFERGAKLSYPQAIEDLGQIVSHAEGLGKGRVGTVGFCMGGTLVMLLASREPRVAGGVIYYGFPANPTLSENRPWEPLQETAEAETPLLGFWGDQDHGVGMDNVERYRAGLAEAGKPHDFTIYPGLPHGFLTFDDSSPNYQGSQDSWRKTLDFYGRTLKQA
jgi:carboxymethylenebutenolidase